MAPLKEIKFRNDESKLNLRKDTLAAMDARNKARKCGHKNLYKQLRNKVSKLVKRDQIQGVLKHIGTDPGPRIAWQEAKSYLGIKGGSSLPDCTNNVDPKFTAENQNNHFINKIKSLVSTIPSGKKSFECDSCHSNFIGIEDLNTHICDVHEGKKSFDHHGC